MIELRSVSKTIGSTAILIDASLRVQRGECVVIVGASGAGKTTLLRLIAGLDTPDAGSILLRDREVSRPGWTLPPFDRRLGFQFQDSALWPHMSLLQNVAYALNGDKRRAAECLDRAGVGALAGRRPSEVSGGEARRAALARALVPRHDIVLLDEPLSSLQMSLRETMRRWICEELRACQAACLWVTHDPVEAADFADRIMLIKGGMLQGSQPLSASITI